MKLHLGCGGRYLEGWVNIDILETSKADTLDNITTLCSVSDDSCDIIYASHVLEHFGRHDYKKVLLTWKRKLKKGGILRLAVPSFEAAIQWYDGSNLEDILGLLCGGQKDVFDYHKMIFDENTLTQALEEAGFSDIVEWDWRNTEHSFMDDYSQSYLPHMEKDKGLLVSLNLEGTK